MKQLFNKYTYWFVGTVIGLLVVDMLTKVFIYDFPSPSKPIIPGVISFYSYPNDGIAFGMFGGGGVWMPIVQGLLALGAITAWWFMGKRHMFLNISFALFIAGAVGNLYDRLAYKGIVRDFIRFEFWPSFPIFNVADMCISFAVVMFLIYFIFLDRKPKEAKNAP